jgi:Cu+-exporting ATPase
MENCSVLKDPVCGMTVTNKSFHHLEQDGQSHYFCGTKCKARFAANLAPERGQPAYFGWMLLAGAVVALAVLVRWLA